MRRFFLLAAGIAFITMIVGTALRCSLGAISGWALTILFTVSYLECRDRDSKRRADRQAEKLRKKHANDLDTQQFSTILTREQLMRDYEKIKL